MGAILGDSFISLKLFWIDRFAAMDVIEFRFVHLAAIAEMTWVVMMISGSAGLRGFLCNAVRQQLAAQWPIELLLGPGADRLVALSGEEGRDLFLE